MRHQLMILGAVASFAWTGSVLAQTATDTTTPPPATTSPTTSHAGAYDALSDGNKKIVSAIYEAQLGSANDTGSGTLLTRDDIAAMRQDTGWGNVYHKLQEQGLVTEKNLGQAVSNYNHSTRAGSDVTVISTAGGEQTTVGKGKSDGAASSADKSGGGNSATAKAEHGKPTTVTTAAGGTAGATVATQSSAGGVSRAGGNGNGQAGGKIK